MSFFKHEGISHSSGVIYVKTTFTIYNAVNIEDAIKKVQVAASNAGLRVEIEDVTKAMS